MDDALPGEKAFSDIGTNATCLPTFSWDNFHQRCNEPQVYLNPGGALPGNLHVLNHWEPLIILEDVDIVFLLLEQHGVFQKEQRAAMLLDDWSNQRTRSDDWNTTRTRQGFPTKLTCQSDSFIFIPLCYERMCKPSHGSVGCQTKIMAVIKSTSR